MKQSSLLIAFSIISLLGYSQKISMQFGTNFQKMPNSESTQIYQFDSYRPLENSTLDSIFLVTTFQSASTYQYEYLPKLGYHLGANIRFSITKEIFFETGFKLPYSKFEIKDTTIFKLGSIGIISTDTVIGAELPTNSYCVNFNDYNEVLNSLNQSRTFSIVNLLIPFKFYYEVMAEELSFSVGSYLSTNIYSNYYSARVDYSIDEIMGEQAYCTFYPDITDDSSGSNLRSYNFGATVGGEYWFKNYGIELMYDQRLQNLFVSSDDFDYHFGGHSTKPFFTNFTFKYRFGNYPRLENK